LLAKGAVERRTFLDLKRIPPFDDRGIEHVGFIHGELVEGATAENLFRRLASIRVTPFLLATDGNKVLMATLSPAPTSTPSGSPRPAVLANLQRFLRGIEIVREPVNSLDVVVDHRYDRLFTSDRSS
jgi:hypothetical protein